jgi:hypothetical protein
MTPLDGHGLVAGQIDGRTLVLPAFGVLFARCG